MAKLINIKLAKRERNLIAFCVLFVGVALVLQFLVLPWFDKRESRINGIAAREKSIQEMVLLQAEFMAARKNTRGLTDQLASRPKNFALFSYLEKAAGTTKVKEFITYMKPSAASSKGDLKESLVEMKLENVQLEKLSNYLKKIESPEDVVYLKRLSIQTSKKKEGTLDAVLQVLTYEKDTDEKGGAEKNSPAKANG